MPSTRRITTLAGAAFVGVAATAMFAAPASAWTATVKGDAVCDQTTGTWTVNWSVDNTTESTKAKLTVEAHTPAASSVQLLISEIEKQKKTEKVAVQTGVPANAGTATMKLKVEWFNANNPSLDKRYPTGTVSFEGKTCTKTPPSNGGGGGGTPATPTPTPTPTASTPAATPTLPVTGSQTGLYAGGAVVLLGAGAGLFMVARRRRVKFEA